MLSKTLFILFCLMIFNCSSMVEALQCHISRFAKDKKTVSGSRVMQCEDKDPDEAKCSHTLVYKPDPGAMDAYNQGCFQNVFRKTGEERKMGGLTCYFINATTEYQIACPCIKEKCNDYENPIFNAMLKTFKLKTGKELTDLVAFPGYVPPTADLSVITTEDTPTDAPTEDPASQNQSTEKNQSDDSESGPTPGAEDNKPADTVSKQSGSSGDSSVTGVDNTVANGGAAPLVDEHLTEDDDQIDGATAETTTSGSEVKQFWIILCFVMMIYSIIIV